MRSAPLVMLAAALALPLLVTAARGQQGERAKSDAPTKVVIPFDFESKFDEGRYGRMVGEMFWKKLQDQGGFIIPESMLDVREFCQRRRFAPNPQTSLDEMKAAVRDGLGGDLAVWGKVERAAGAATDVYDLTIVVADFSSDPPRIVHRVQARTKTVSEIPHVYAKAALDELYGRKPGEPAPPDPAIERRWRSGRNLVAGDFERGRAAPAGWDPLPQYMTWQAERGDSAARNRFLRMEFPKDVAATTGVLYYSEFFPIEEGATYRFQCRWRTSGSAVKVFIKCYDDVAGRFGKRPGSTNMQRREVYRSQQNLKGAKNQWNVHTEDFTPKHTQYTPRWGRVMLYGYWPAGRVEWDDVVVKQIVPPPKDAGQKIRRPSQESNVRTDELPPKDR